MSVHHLSCHCGAVQFDAELDLSTPATCNCSICGRTGAIMAFVPTSNLSNVVGEDKLVDYQFGKKSIHHVFCSICGCRPFARGAGHDGAEWAMVNLRCIEGLDVHTLQITKQYDGRSL